MTKKKRFPISKRSKSFLFNYKYKDRLFCKVFESKEDLLQLYNAVNNTAYTNPEELIITTLEDTIILSMKNDLSFIISSDMNLYEHQSTFNPNMPIRGVFYFARLYEVYVAQRGLDIYGSKLVKVPTPQYVVFYNGDTEKPDRMVLKLSDAFCVTGGVVPAMECRAIMLNINYGHNKELLDKCRRLKEYSIFTTKVRTYANTGISLNEAIDKAMDECVEEGVLVDILLKHRTLARNTLLTEYDEKKRRKLDRQEGFEDGFVQGIEQTLLVIVTKKVRKNQPLDMIAADLEEDIEVLRPIYEEAKRKQKENL